MSDRSKIEWTDATWNPVFAWRKTPNPRRDGRQRGWHCEHVSEGCRNCYAERMNRRLGNGLDYKPGNRAQVEIGIETVHAPLRWRKPRMVFVGSMTDIFADFVTDNMLDRIFATMALCPQHTFQVLTKRPARMWSYLTTCTGKFDVGHACGRVAGIIERMVDERGWRTGVGPLPFGQPGAKWWPLANVWLGVSVEDQATADERIPDLLATPAAIRFVSYEPALGPVDFTAIERRYPSAGGFMRPLDGRFNRIDWLICGGESGPGARPMHPDWARSARDQCAAAGVAFFMKQLSGKNGRAIKDVELFPSDLRVRQYPDVMPEPGA